MPTAGFSLGTLSVSIQASLGDFTTKLSRANKAITAFADSLNKAFTVKKTDIIPPGIQTQLDSAARAAAKLAASLEKLQQYGLTTQKALAGLGPEVGRGLNTLMNTIEKGAGPAAKDAAKGMDDLAKAAGPGLYSETAKGKEAVAAMTYNMERQRRALQATLQPMSKVKVAYKNMADGTVKGTLVLKHATQETTNAFEQMRRNSILQLISLKSMVGKILHYITFSFGVQMVMQVRQGFSSMIESFKEFERAATNATTVSGNLGRSFDDVKQHIMDMSIMLGRKTVFSANEVAAAYYNLASAGYDVANLTENELIPILNYAAATQASLEDATFAVATALKAFNMELSESQRVVDVFTASITSSFMTFTKMQEAMKYAAPIAGVVGVSLEETVAALTMLVDRGLEGGQAGQRLNMIFTKLLKPTDEATELLYSMGLTLDDINPEFYSLTEILFKLQAAGFGAGEMADMFRARTAAAAAVLIQSAEDIERYNTQLLLSKGITQTVAESQVDTLWGALQLVHNELVATGNAIGEQLMPYIKGFADFVKGTLAPTIKSIVSILLQWLPTIVNVVKWFIKLKLIMWATTTAFKVYTMVITLAGTLQNIYNIALNKFGAISLKNIGYAIRDIALKKAQIAVTGSLVAVTSALAAVVAIVAFGAMVIFLNGIFDTLDGLLTLGDTVKDTSLAIVRDFELTKAQLADVFTPLQMAMYEWRNSGKSFLESVKLIKKEFSDIDIQDEKILNFFASLDEFAVDTPYRVIEYAVKLKDPTAEVSGQLSELVGIWQTEYADKIIEFQKKYPFGVIPQQYIDREIKSFSLGDLQAYWADYWSKQFRETYGDAWDKAISDFNSYYQTLYDTTEEFTGNISFAQITDDVKEVMNTALASIMDGMTYLEAIDFTEATKFTILLSTELSTLREIMKDTKQAVDEELLAEKELDVIRKNTFTDTEELLNAEVKYTQATEKRKQLFTDLIGASKDLLTEMRRYSETMNTGIEIVQNYIAADRDLRYSKEDLEDAFRAEETALLDLSEALATYGAQTTEAENAEARLSKAIQNRVKAQEDVSKLATAARLAEEEYQYTLDYGVRVELNKSQLEAELKKKGTDVNQKIEDYISKYSSEQQRQFMEEGAELEITLPITDMEKQLIETSQLLAKAQEDLVTSSSKKVLLDAQILGLEKSRDNYLKLTNEKMKQYLENQLKIYDIEEKLYKLREGEQDQFDSLFQKMAEEGMVNEETIDLYKELKQSEGEVLGLNNDLMGVYGDLTDSQREIVEQYINGDISLDEMNAMLAENNELTKDGDQITQGQIDTIVAYTDANNRLKAAVEAFGDALGPLMQDLIDIGALSPEVAAAWGDIADNEAEAAKYTIDLAMAIADVDNMVAGLIGNTVRLARSLQDTADEDSILDVLDELVEQMGLTDAIGGDLLGTLNAFYETGYSSLQDFTEAQIIAALSMIQAADAAHLWEQGMSGANLANEMNVSSVQGMINEATIAIDAQETMYELQRQLKEAVNGVTEAVDNLTEVFKEYLSLTTGLDPLVISTKFDFSSLMDAEEYKDNISELLSDLEDIDVDFDLGLTKSWEKEDWTEFRRLIEKTEFGKLIGKSMVDVGIPITPEMNINDWKQTILSNQDKVDKIFELYQTSIKIDTKWDGVDWSKWIGSLQGDKKSAFETAVSEMQAALGITTKWGGYDSMEEYMRNLSASELTILSAYLQSNGVDLPIDTDMTALYQAFSEIGLMEIPEKIVNIIADTSGLNDLQVLMAQLFPDREFDVDVTVPTLDEYILQGLTQGITAGVSNLMYRATYGAGQGEREIEVAGRTISNVFDQGALSMQGSFELGEGAILGAFDSVTGQVLGTYDTATGKLEGSFNTVSNQVVGVFDTSSGRFIGAVDTATGEFRLSSGVFGDDVTESGVTFAGFVTRASVQMYSLLLAAATAIRSAVSGSEGHQRGLIATSPTWGVFGEKGAEALVPLEGGNKKFGENILRTILPMFPDIQRDIARYVMTKQLKSIMGKKKLYKFFQEKKLKSIMDYMDDDMFKAVAFEKGGIVGGRGYSSTENMYNDNFNIMGPITVQGVQNTEDFMSDMKFKMRYARRY